ncbi:hypothetical protein BDZ45DRAFT_130564 [Acephala macrosclerotiorum]|nr:hypothetical protein BDZ45DRAFT_130564 [Acephala macrosclerotiorum]
MRGIVATVSARAIGDLMPHLNPSAPLAAAPPSEAPQCVFHPHNHLTHDLPQRPMNPAAYSNIPTHAWPHISSLLLSHSNSLTTGSPMVRNNVQTLRLSSLTNDISLESVVVGLVFTAPENSPAAGHELRSLPLKGESRVGMKEELVGEGEAGRKCVEEAIRNVESAKQVEGVLEMSGRGKFGYLVYRTD